MVGVGDPCSHPGGRAPESRRRAASLRWLADEIASVKEGGGGTISDEQLSREFKESANAELPAELEAKLKAFFDKMDADSNGEVSKTEAVAFWGKNFAKVNAQSMFNEVDADGNESISWAEFRKFWQNVIGSGYPAEDISEDIFSRR